MVPDSQNELSAMPLVWDAHACLPLVPNADMSPLARHRQAGADFVCVNVGMDFNPLEQIVRVIAGFRDWILDRPEDYVLTRSVADVRHAKATGKLAVSFDLEGSAMLQDDLAMCRLFRDLGVSQIHLAYNRDNSIAGGCHGSGMGLTPLGRQVVGEINRVGMIMDCAHSSKRSSLDVMEISQKPVIFSHANPSALQAHPRNIDDEQIRGCAETGGVIGISGIADFLGSGEAVVDNVSRHIDYVVQMVGPAHAGVGLDYVYDESRNELPENLDVKDWWPPHEYGESGPKAVFPPEKLGALADALDRRGYGEADVAAILGGNFLRIAETSWDG